MPRATFPSEIFEVAQKLADGYESFRDEAAALADDEWIPWPERAAYNHGWETFLFVMTTLPAGLVTDFRKNRARCPKSWELLRDPRIVLAGFSRLQPGAHIYAHSDHPAFDILRFHIGLNNAGRAGMRVSDGTRQQQPGEHYVFDSSLEHEAGNLGAHKRDVLLVDFRASEQELAIVDQLRAEHRETTGA